MVYERESAITVDYSELEDRLKNVSQSCNY